MVDKLREIGCRVDVLERSAHLLRDRRGASTDELKHEVEAVERELEGLELKAHMTPQQIRDHLELCERGKQRYEEAKKALSKKNLRLVVSIAKKFRNKGLPFLDLIQEGNTGLMKALDRYQASRGNKFSTYATWWIKQTITRSIAYQSRTVRIPIHAINNLNRLIEDREDFLKRSGREPTIEEMSKISKISPKGSRSPPRAQPQLALARPAVRQRRRGLLRRPDRGPEGRDARRRQPALHAARVDREAPEDALATASVRS